MSIRVVRTVEEIRTLVAEKKAEGLKTCVVPTMGGLHAGHMSLVDHAANIADFIVVTLFVNPTQFNNAEDLANYPGNEQEDLAMLEASPAHVVYAPSSSEMYPEGFATKVTVNAGTDILCDAFRPGHFGGVATVCTKLFLQTGTDHACFGEKDYQQLFIIRSLVRDLNIPISIEPVKTVREKDGLAMSSRNKRLSEEERKVAAQMHAAMQQAAEQIAKGTSASSACKSARESLEAGGQFAVEYLEMRDAATLELVDQPTSPARLFAAAWLGDVRLIDNIPV